MCNFKKVSAPVYVVVYSDNYEDSAMRKLHIVDIFAKKEDAVSTVIKLRAYSPELIFDYEERSIL